MAEVLITLGIIGVVAAITMPALITKHRTEVLKNQLKKSYSSLAQAIQLASNESGINNLGTYCSLYDGNSFPNRSECNDILFKQIKLTKERCDYKGKVYNYNKSKNNAHIDVGGTAFPRFRTSDGSCVDFTVNASTAGFTVDVNGDLKGPNALGHDIFVFWINNKGALTPVKSEGFLTEEELQDKLNTCNSDNPANNACASSAAQINRPCSINSNQRGNGLGCSWFAVNDICPDDPTKKYWECLP